MKIFKSIHRYDRQKGSLHAWIRKVVINEGLNHLNQRKQYLDTVELETAEAPEISNAALVKMSATDIMRFIRKLPPATHSVFVLFAIEGYSHREISRSLGISEGTSKWHLNEARKSLQRSILIHNADGREDNI